MKRVKWNFEKFLIGRDGRVKGRWASMTTPDKLKGPIEKELAGTDTATATEAPVGAGAESGGGKSEL